MSDITKSEVLNSLRRIDDPKIGKEFLILNSIRKFELEKDNLDLSITLPISEENKKEIESKFTEALKKDYSSLRKIDINIETKIIKHQDKKKDVLLPEVKNTIAVASGKGGVGKSTVAVNLAVALAKDGAKVGLLDADIYGPSIPIMLGINQKPKVYQNKQTMKMIPLESYGIKLISIGLLVDDKAPVIWRGPMASGAVKQFMSDVDWGELDYLIFDMPPGTGDIQLTLVQTVPLTGGVIVTTPQEVSLIDARKASKMFSRVNVPVLGIVENMSYFIAPDTGKKYDIFGIGGGERLSEELGTFFLGAIPIEPQIRIGGDKGIPIVFDTPDSQQAAVVSEIARKLAQRVHVRNLQAHSKVEILLDDE